MQLIAQADRGLSISGSCGSSGAAGPIRSCRGKSFLRGRTRSRHDSMHSKLTANRLMLLGYLYRSDPFSTFLRLHAGFSTGPLTSSPSGCAFRPAVDTWRWSMVQYLAPRRRKHGETAPTSGRVLMCSMRPRNEAAANQMIISSIPTCMARIYPSLPTRSRCFEPFFPPKSTPSSMVMIIKGEQ